MSDLREWVLRASGIVINYAQKSTLLLHNCQCYWLILELFTPPQAIEVLGAERIGHGYHVLDDEKVYELAKTKGVHFEVSEAHESSLHHCYYIITTTLLLHHFYKYYTP